MRAVQDGDEFALKMIVSAKSGLLYGSPVMKSPALFSRMNRACPNT